jgi:GNAT superfamily N-acetyltransferase
MLVRDATIADAGTIVDFNLRLARDSGDEVPDEPTLRRGVVRALARVDLCRYVLAEVDGEVAGQAMVTYEWSDWRDGTLWWLQSVFVRPRFRRRGVFRALYEHLRGLALADPDARGLRLYALTANERALAAYLACGMARTGYEVLEAKIQR